MTAWPVTEWRIVRTAPRPLSNYFDLLLLLIIISSDQQPTPFCTRCKNCLNWVNGTGIRTIPCSTIWRCVYRQCSECVKAADVNDDDTSDASQPRRLRHKTLLREPVKYASTYLQPLCMVIATYWLLLLVLHLFQDSLGKPVPER